MRRQRIHGLSEGARSRLGIGSPAAGARRSRSRTLTPRGRATAYAGLSLLLLLGLGLTDVVALLPDRDDWGVFETRREVSAAPLQAVPLSVLARLPTTRAVLDLERSAPGSGHAQSVSAGLDPAAPARFVEWVGVAESADGPAGPLRVEYSLDAGLTEQVFSILKGARTQRGHVVVMDVQTGRVLAFASTDARALPYDRAYPAASLVKVVTAAAAIEYAPRAARRPCRYRGSPYRLTRSRIHPARNGREASLEKAMAGSYNQCFAQLAVHVLGRDAMLSALRRFGWLSPPGPGHAAGWLSEPDDDYALGRVGAGLEATRITPLHAAQLTSVVAHGELVFPWWIDRVVDAEGRELTLPERGARQPVIGAQVAREVREMMVRTTRRGTARSAFRNRRGRALLDDVRVAGKTGNLTGRDPKGRYEWFAGVAPADAPRIGVAVLQVHGHLWWKTSSQIAASVLQEVFCVRNRCRAELAARYTGALGDAAAPVMLSAESASARGAGGS